MKNQTKRQGVLSGLVVPSTCCCDSPADLPWSIAEAKANAYAPVTYSPNMPKNVKTTKKQKKTEPEPCIRTTYLAYSLFLDERTSLLSCLKPQRPLNLRFTRVPERD